MGKGLREHGDRYGNLVKSSGSRLLATAQVTEAEKSVHFSSPRGAERGRLVRLDKHQFGIIDRRENQIGIIRPAGGLRAWKSRRYELIIDDKPVLEMHCDNQVPWRIYFTIDRVGNVGKEREQLLLRCAFALRLIAPELMKDPVISTLKKARGDLRDNIEELF